MSSTDATVITGGAGEQAAAPSPGLPTVPDVTIERELGRGGMGAVYLGRQTYLDRQVAVKVLLEVADEGFAARFRREATILAGLAHPHIVACHSAGIAPDGHPYLVMEFVDGPDLKRWVATHGPLPSAAAVRVVREVAAGLAHAAAQGIIHRDVKPENVLLAKRAGAAADDAFPWTAKLADLGLARPAQPPKGSAANLTLAGQVLGTPATMAPEQFDDPEGVDQRADIYGLGCVLYHALTGTPAFTGTSFAAIVASKVHGPAPDPSRTVRSVPPALSGLCGRMLARDRAQRPQDYAALTAELDACAGGPAARSGGRGALIAVAVVVVAVVVVAVGLGAVAMTGGGAKPAVAPTAQAVVQVATPAAPAPVPAPSALQPLSAPVELFGGDVPERLRAWDQVVGWAVAEEAPGVAASGHDGWMSRRLPGLPIRVSATMTVPEQWDWWLAGVVLNDGSVVAVRAQNIADVTAALGRWGSTGQLKQAQLDGTVPRGLASGGGKLMLDIRADRLVASIGGVGIGDLPLAAPPVSLVFAAKGDDSPGHPTFITISDPQAQPR